MEIMVRSGHRIALLVATLGVGAGALSCIGEDPVHDDQVANLPGEVPGIPIGEYHRAGQQCTLCHGPEGPANTEFSMAGTVFDAKDSLVGVGNVQVLLVDSLGSSPPTGSVVTNCVGNFYVTPDQWTPAFPVLVGLQSGATSTAMLTQISRATSCAQCHADPASTSAIGHVYIDVSVNPMEESACPVSPNAAPTGVP
jgi:hypothetical protein